MFNHDFYPTPLPVIEQMCAGYDFVGSHVLEPSAGKGDIVHYLKKQGAVVTVCELDANLSIIAGHKADKFLKYDFLKVTKEEVSHIEYIVMNPPFSADERHILHAWNIAPEGCTIISLCNSNTISNYFSNATRTKLKSLIETNGNNTPLGNVFSQAERSTNCEIELIKLFKPKTGNSEFDGYFDHNEEDEKQENGIMQYNEIRSIVNRYVGAVKIFDEVNEASEKITNIIAPINESGRLLFGARQTRSGHEYPITRDVFKKELCKSAWHTVFAKMDMNKYVTNSVMANINKFVELQTSVPFTMTNIYKMFEIIIGTHGSRMDDVLVEAFDKICSYSADNSEAGDSWKTNSNYKVNQKFIIPYMVEVNYHGKMTYNCGRSDYLNDIIKALCNLTGKDYNTFTSFYRFINDSKIEFGEWVTWNEFFQIKGYKKGTLHVRFINEDVWGLFNQRVAKIKGWVLPQTTNHKQKGTERS